MRTVVFLDLDGTVFQTLPKCPPNAETIPAADSRDGTPLSFMTAKQQALFNMLAGDGPAPHEIIPTTARNHGAFRRVRLPFHSHAILDFGGVILSPGGELDPAWDNIVRPQALAFARALADLHRALASLIQQRGLQVRIRQIDDFGMPLYLVMKHPAGDLGELAIIEEHLPSLDLDGIFVHANDNNLSLVPSFIGKEKAVAHLLEHYYHDEPTLILGAGDSFTDAPFLRLCDFWLTPGGSQLSNGASAEEGEKGRRGEGEKEPIASRHLLSPSPLLPFSPSPADTPFTGSYAAEDVVFLLKPIEQEPTALEEKEQLIQSGTRHYSEMIGKEEPPSETYLRIFHEGLARNKRKLARDVLRLAGFIARDHEGDIVLASLARAGTPIGVLLRRALGLLLGRTVHHFSLSIIRDRGIDENALGWMLDRFRPEQIAFVDGWTGKGVIATELERSVARFNRARGTRLDTHLYAVADLCGRAKAAATAEDYLIPSAILGCTVSGLVSRSILNDRIGPGDFHGCVHYREMAQLDLSRWFADALFEEMKILFKDSSLLDEQTCEDLQKVPITLPERYGESDRLLVKPGIGEATRVLLRRIPDRVVVRDRADEDVAHLLWLANRKQVPVLVDPSLPYRALALIKDLRE